MLTIDDKFQIKPERASIILSQLGFDLVPWSRLAKNFGKVSTDERTYGITFKFGEYTYILGKLYCDTEAEIYRPFIGNHNARGFFFDLESDGVASDLGVWAEDPDKRFEDERRYAIISDNPHETDIHYHVMPKFDGENVYQKLMLARGPLIVAGFKDVDQSADIPFRYTAYYNSLFH